MTDKEKIIIDGVNVSQCEFYIYYSSDRYPHRCGIHKDMFGIPACCDVADCCKNCYFKQLKHKEQECEELKEIISDFISDNRTMYCYDDRQPITLEEIQECIEFTYNAGLKYKQTLETIGKECKFVIDNRECYDLREADRCELILNLINKAKGSNNDR